MTSPAIEPINYGVEEVQEILGIGKSKAYDIIRKLNAELDKKGYLTVRGKVNIKYFQERMYAGGEV